MPLPVLPDPSEISPYVRANVPPSGQEVYWRAVCNTAHLFERGVLLARAMGCSRTKALNAITGDSIIVAKEAARLESCTWGQVRADWFTQPHKVDLDHEPGLDLRELQQVPYERIHPHDFAAYYQHFIKGWAEVGTACAIARRIRNNATTVTNWQAISSVPTEAMAQRLYEEYPGRAPSPDVFQPRSLLNPQPSTFRCRNNSWKSELTRWRNAFKCRHSNPERFKQICIEGRE